MTLEEKLSLSYYHEVACIDESHGITLVQHVTTKKFYVKKTLSVYNRFIFDYIFQNPIINTPRLYEVVEDNSTLIIIEEYIPGNTLQEILDEKHYLSEAEVIPYMLQLCTVLSALHACDPPIIHRDLKPSNIMLTPDGNIKLLDLNAAKYVDHTKDKDTTLLGTQGYAAPEQYGFGSSNTQTDIYSLGILINALLSGNVSHECTIYGNLAPIVQRCIKIDPKERYSSIFEVASALTFVSQKYGFSPKNQFVSEEPHPSHTLSTDSVSPVKINSSNTLPTWMRFLPPGFRTLNPLHMIVGFIGYLFIFWLGFTTTFENATDAVTIFQRFFLTIMLFAMVLFGSNYLDVQRVVPICRCKNIVLRILSIILMDVAVGFFIILVMAIWESIFFK